MNNQTLQKRLREIGAKDAAAGKPIDAFNDTPFPRHTEQMRAAYEIGWRNVTQLLRASRKATR